MRVWVKLPAAPSSKFGIFAQPPPTLLSIDHVLAGKWQGGSKPLRLEPSRWAELAKRAGWRGKNVFGYQRRLFALAQERVLHAGVAGGRVANTG